MNIRQPLLFVFTRQCIYLYIHLCISYKEVATAYDNNNNHHYYIYAPASVLRSFLFKHAFAFVCVYAVCIRSCAVNWLAIQRSLKMRT